VRSGLGAEQKGCLVSKCLDTFVGPTILRAYLKQQPLLISKEGCLKPILPAYVGFVFVTRKLERCTRSSESSKKNDF